MKPAVPLVVLAVGVVLAAALAVSQDTANAARASCPIPSSVTSRLSDLAYRWAVDEGDRVPVSVLAVRTTLARATRLTDRADSVPGTTSTPVYLVVEGGRFNHPYGLWTPGPVPDLEMIFGARQLAVDSFGLGRGNKLTPTVTFGMLRKLGPVCRLAKSSP